MKLIKKRHSIQKDDENGEVTREIKEEVIKETKTFSLRLRNKIKSKANDVKEALEERNGNNLESDINYLDSEQNTFHTFKRRIHKRHLRPRLEQ